LTHYAGLKELNQTLPKRALVTAIDIRKERKAMAKPKGRNEARHRLALAKAYDSLVDK